ncbi:hypothetical protein B5M09_007708 [Aphanomyces astaci]|uniref:Uncharacterized protein n=1 Tax=Aphanomyces astaci TaxID=112090 RepID=A0A425DDJ5_APHAT|nr:hypothetical protein B5M09_007708 [Aphanomyces astaci]
MHLRVRPPLPTLWHALALYICMLSLFSSSTHMGVSATQVVQYTFDKARAGGVVGSIHVTYDSPHKPTVSITTDIDMSALNMTQVLALHPACEPHIQEFKWYLVVNDVGVVPLVGRGVSIINPIYLPLLWSHVVEQDLESVDGVATDNPSTCNDTDPVLAPSPSSSSSPPSPPRTLHLSEHLGRLVVQHDGRISQSWQDVPFPSYDQVTPRWSIVLHAVCGDTSPPVVCARVDFELKATNSHVQSKEAHGIVGVAAFVLASSLLLFLT